MGSAIPTVDAAFPDRDLSGADAATFGGDAAPDSAFDRPSCGSVDPSAHRECPTIDGLVLTDPVGGSRRAAPGDSVTISMVLTNTSNRAYGYPCTGLVTNDSLATVLPPNPRLELFSILPGMSATLTHGVALDRAIPGGTTVHLKAWVDLERAGCTNGATLSVDLVVE